MYRNSFLLDCILAILACRATSLHRAASTGQLLAVKVLLESGKADLTVEDKTGATALLIAVTCANDSVRGSARTNAIISCGIYLNADKEGNTPIRYVPSIEPISSLYTVQSTSANCILPSVHNYHRYVTAGILTKHAYTLWLHVASRSLAAPPLQQAMKAAAAGENMDE
eukprot:3846292-Pyramimonas_sp.AAC.1